MRRAVLRLIVIQGSIWRALRIVISSEKPKPSAVGFCRDGYCVTQHKQWRVCFPHLGPHPSDLSAACGIVKWWLCQLLSQMWWWLPADLVWTPVQWGGFHQHWLAVVFRPKRKAGLMLSGRNGSQLFKAATRFLDGTGNIKLAFHRGPCSG